MKIVSIGGGPAGLYFGILMKEADPSADIRVIERNRADDTFGFGVVFSDATLGNLEAADPVTYAEIRRHFAHWDDIDTYLGGERHRSTGHGFCGMSRMKLLEILQARCRELGVVLEFEREVTDLAALAGEVDLVIGADGVASGVRAARAEVFEPAVDDRPNRFVWLGTTFPFEAFTFYFNQNQHGLWRVHAYRYSDEGSTFIVECTEDTWRRAGMNRASEDQTIAYLEGVFADELAGHRLTKNRSIWRQFPTVTNRRWHAGNVVLVGDAAHTAHFSIGSGTKLAMEDCIALVDALGRERDLPAALALYERERRPEVEKLQRAAQISLEWFEHTERYVELAPIQFTFSLLTRSLRVTHENLRVRDPEFVARFDSWFADTAADQSQQTLRDGPPSAPRACPLRLRNLVLGGRLVAAPHAAADQVAHARARATNGAALVMTPRIDAAGDLAPWAAVAGATRAEEAASGALLVLGHPGYSVPEPPAGDAAERWLARLATAATTLSQQGFDLLELDLSTGLLLELYAEDAERDTLLGAIAAVRAAWPAHKPLSVRVPAIDWDDADDINPDRAVALARSLAAAPPAGGVDLATVVSIGAGTETRLGNAAFAERVRLEGGLRVVTEGGVWSLEDADSVIAAGRADLCSFVGDDRFRPRRAAG